MLERLLAGAPSLDRDGGAPAHAQIEHWLTYLIERRELVPGDKIPREADLAAGLGVSRMTLRQALGRLESRGVVERVPGRYGGTFVVEPKIDCDITGLAGFTEQLRRGQVRAFARVVSARELPVSREVARALRLAPADRAYEVVRVRSARRSPLALERSYFPAEQFPGLLGHRLTGSLYELLRREYNSTPHTAREFLEPVKASQAESALLRVDPATPLMLIERTAYSSAGIPVEFARDLFRPDRIRITVRTSACGQA